MIGQKIIFKETLNSTNNYAANLLQSGELAHGTVIMSGEQTAGRGQRGTTWAAEPYKNLIFTCFLVYDNLSVEKQQSITHLVSLALVETLAAYTISAQIKWPNDICVKGQKIAGILIENQLENQRCKSSIVGIGMNVNQTSFDGFLATSMQLEKSEEYVVDSVAFTLMQKLEEKYQILQNYGIEILKNNYLENLWRKDEWRTYEDIKGQFEGKIIGTEESGKLLVERIDGIKAYDLKEIIYL